MLLDLRGLPPQYLPELWGLLALHHECDFCLPFPLILVNFLCKEPEDRCKAFSKVMLLLGMPSFAQSIRKTHLPGLGGVAQRSLGPPPHIDVQSSVQEEHKSG